MYVYTYICKTFYINRRRWLNKLWISQISFFVCLWWICLSNKKKYKNWRRHVRQRNHQQLIKRKNIWIHFILFSWNDIKKKRFLEYLRIVFIVVFSSHHHLLLFRLSCLIFIKTFKWLFCLFCSKTVAT